MEKVEACEVKTLLSYIKEFNENKMCGKCLPCMMGSSEAASILERIAKGEGNDDDLNLLAQISAGVNELARCKFGREMALRIAESLEAEEDLAKHVAEEKSCPKGTCQRIVRYCIIPEKCVMCGLCKSVCPEEAIIGEEFVPYRSDNEAYTIRERKCTGCGLCLAICDVNAIVILGGTNLE